MEIDFEIEPSCVIAGVFTVKPSNFNDKRGSIWTSWNPQLTSKLGLSNEFIHDKFSRSKKNVLRGIHYDNRTYKLVTCVTGRIKQVVVDMRSDSPSYLNWQIFDIEAANPISVLVPPMCGNAFYALDEDTVYHYKLSYIGDYADVAEQFTVRWDDPEIGIDWGVTDVVLSSRDNIK